MTEIPDAPDIRNALFTGYPHIKDDFVRVCPRCDDDIPYDEQVFTIDGQQICKCCFKDWVNELTPVELAKYLDVEVEDAYDD